jgi:hypothetical protein
MPARAHGRVDDDPQVFALPGCERDDLGDEDGFMRQVGFHMSQRANRRTATMPTAM